MCQFPPSGDKIAQFWTSSSNEKDPVVVPGRPGIRDYLRARPIESLRVVTWSAALRTITARCQKNSRANSSESEAKRRTDEVEVTTDLAAFDRASLARTDLLLMRTCQQSEISLERREAFLAAVREGLPIVALHCTFWSFQAWPEFRQVLGAFVPGHAPFGPMCVQPTSDAGNLAAGLPGRFELIDEPYHVNERDPAMKVIATSCVVYTDSDGKRRDGVETSVWTKSFGKGRVFAMTFGHDRQSQGSDSFKRLFINGVRWALRMD